MRTRRFSRPVRPRKVFLVLCEGETEKAYIELLKRYYHLPIVIKTKVSGAGINERLVKQYVKEISIDKTDICRVFYVYDCDVEAVRDKIVKLDGTAILSNPCIELWFMLHANDHRSNVSSNTIVKHLQSSHPVWHSYCKGRITSEQACHLLSHCAEAAKRAAKLAWPGNPSSNMSVFIDALETDKNS